MDTYTTSNLCFCQKKETKWSFQILIWTLSVNQTRTWTVQNNRKKQNANIKHMKSKQTIYKRKRPREPVEPSNLTLQQLELNCCVVWPEEKWPPDWAWFLPRLFSPFFHQWSFGSLPLSPLACLVGDTSFPAISSTWWTETFELNWAGRCHHWIQ